ncbi:hypothetical protein M2281_005573 [Mesorhizobium soli]|uniref:hypothetical protein n=1 Tax=Pseudaminobacter soli (ex Li et al. 2025) TaxID=1295366 RepID=UPI002474B07D|nr:hypothetical protein [Mesorhizobium soli]MDH6234952.1 hypothetical protein [Mesorhizobium soli]
MKRTLRAFSLHDHASLLRALCALNASTKSGKVSALASLPADDRNQRGAEAHA